MGRGIPGVWSTVLAFPFLAGGGILYLGDLPYPRELGIPLMFFGAFVIIVGWYIHLIALPPQPKLREGENLIESRHPTQKAAIAKVILSMPFLAITAYLLFWTLVPYVYPTIVFILGLYLLGTGILTYWRNSLTTYYLTTDRIVSEYRLFALVRNEVPLTKVRAVRESKSIIEAFVGIGNIKVATGGGSGLEIAIRNIDSPTKFSDELRKLT